MWAFGLDRQSTVRLERGATAATPSRPQKYSCGGFGRWTTCSKTQGLALALPTEAEKVRFGDGGRLGWSHPDTLRPRALSVQQFLAGKRLGRRYEWTDQSAARSR